MKRCIICNFVIDTTIPLPEATPWTGRDRPVDLYIRSGSVPPDLGQPTEIPFVKRAPGGALILGDRQSPYFYVSQNSIIVDTSAPDWRSYLLGPVMGLVSYLNGLLPLHASAVQIGSRTVAFAGRSGAGKSTTAAALVRRAGHRFITDEVCAVDCMSTSPLAFPHLPFHKLSSESLERLGLDATTVQRPCGEPGKFYVASEEFDPTPCVLHAIYFLETTIDDCAEGIFPVSRLESVYRLQAELYRPDLGGMSVTQASMLLSVAKLVERVRLRRLVRGRRLSDPDSLVRLIESDAGS
jgi:hypothetical protein